MKSPDLMTRDELVDEVHFLRGEIYAIQTRQRNVALHDAFGLTRGEARVILALYDAKGRALSIDQIIIAIYGHESDVSSNIISVHLCRVRKRVGASWTANHWGHGYSMTADGLAAVRAALEAS